MLTGCTDRDDDLTAINIRVKNASTLEFDEILVESEEHLYNALSPDAYSEYQEYETAYRYAYIRVSSGEEEFVLQPIDFVGEEILPVGLYTYELSIDQEGRLTLNFVID